MPKKRTALLDRIAVRLALWKNDRETRKLRKFGKRSATLVLGAALSVGGLSHGFGEVHFLVHKNLDGVHLVKSRGGEDKVVAELSDSFAGNSLFKIARVVPDRFVSQKLTLFDFEWVGSASESIGKTLGPNMGASLSEEISLFNTSIREQFFRTELPFGDLIYEKSQKYDVDPALVAAVMEAESHFRHRARSPRGAMGLMQLMPRTGQWMGARNLYDPEQNVDAGVKYLKYLEKRFNGNLTKQIAAYNAGEGNVRKYNGVPPFRETRSYVKKVMNNYEKRNRQIEKFTETSAERLTEELSAAR